MSIATNATISQSYRSLESIRAAHAAEHAAYEARCRRQDLALLIITLTMIACAIVHSFVV